jgi:GNAT superfamily N-acetyltransferase
MLDRVPKEWTMSNSIQIRDIVAADHEAWLLLWHGYSAFYERTGATAVSPEVTAATWSRFLDPCEPMHALIAIEESRAVGIAHYVFRRNTTMLGMSCYLHDLFTAPALRGRGVGRRLIEAVYERARAAGSPRVDWHTQEINTVARALYDSVARPSDLVVYTQDV